MIESFEKSEEELEDSNNYTYDQDRLPPHETARDQFGNCIPSSPLFEPDRHSDEVNEYEWENRNHSEEAAKIAINAFLEGTKEYASYNSLQDTVSLVEESDMEEEEQEAMVVKEVKGQENE